MGMFYHDLREAMKNQAQGASPLPRIRWTALVCGLAVTMVTAVASAQKAPAAPPRSPKKTHRATKPMPAVPESIPEVTMPAPPPPERRTPEQMPPGIPQVSWDGSELTINADNSTLADILVAIRTRMGAEIDVPPNASRERIAARLGPGPARDVIATLLSWTDYDYIVQASDTDPLGVQSVLLTPRSKSDTAVASAGMGGYGGTPRRGRFGQGNSSHAETSRETPSTPEPETPTETPVAATQPTPAESQPVAAVASPASDAPSVQAEAQSVAVDIPPTQANLNAVAASSGSDSSPSPSSFAERVQNLQNLYQQRKQMTQDARKNPAN